MQSISIKKMAARFKVTDYLHYREYLWALYQHIKEEVENYNYLRFAEDLGFSPTNVIRLTVQGSRKLSMKSARTIANALGLVKGERRYFISIVQYELNSLRASKSSSLSASIAQKISSLTEADEAKLMRYFSSWIHPVMKEAAKDPSFQPNADWFSKKFFIKPSESQIRESIRLLSELGYVSLDPKTQTVTHLSSEKELFLKDAAAQYLTFLRYHEECLERALDALHKVPEELREFNVLTLRLTPDAFAELQSRQRELCEWALQMEEKSVSGSGSVNLLCQVSSQLFSFTRVK